MAEDPAPARTGADPLSVVGVVTSPQAAGRTGAVVAAVLAGCADAGAVTRQLHVVDDGTDAVLAAVDAADAVVIGSPTYRGSCSALAKQLLESLERGRHGETTAPLARTAAAVVMTGGAAEHFLALDALRSPLAGFFAVQVLSPGLYCARSAFDEAGAPTEETAATAALHGRALVELAAAVRGSSALAALEPQL